MRLDQNPGNFSSHKVSQAMMIDINLTFVRNKLLGIILVNFRIGNNQQKYTSASHLILNYSSSLVHYINFFLPGFHSCFIDAVCNIDKKTRNFQRKFDML